MISSSQVNAVELLSKECGKEDLIRVTLEDVNRVLDVGSLLLSVLTEDELIELQLILNGSLDQSAIGNAGVT